MAKHKPPRDPNGRHIRVYCELLDSFAYRALGTAAKVLFFDLRSLLNGANNGNLEATFGRLRMRGWRSPATISKALYELRALGFIAITRAGGLRMGSRVCTLYRFTDLDVYYQPSVKVEAVAATHDYRQYKTLDQAKRARDTGVALFRDEGRSKQRRN